MDMTVLLGNCLENAPEVVRQLPAKRRRIMVEMHPVGAMLLRVINPCEAGADTDGFTDWKAFPSCKAKGRRGVGLRSVSAIADKYNGSVLFQRADGEFTVRESVQKIV